MPTLDELPAAQSVADTDEVLLSQGGNATRATRGQLLAGVQKELVLPAGALLGRVSAGAGEPEALAVGANLSVVRGALTGAAPFVPASLSAGAAPSPLDDVLMVQGGNAHRVNYGTFLAGIAGQPGLDVSGCVVAPRGGVGIRSLADLCADSVAIESFGAVGDGTHDDTEAFRTALNSGVAIRLGTKTYRVDGPIQASAATVIGVPGVSIVLRKAVVAAGAWWTLAGPVTMCGVTMDAGGLAGGTGAVLAVTGGDADLAECVWRGAHDNAAGDGLQLQGQGRVEIANCRFEGNARHGVWCNGDVDLRLTACAGVANAGTGFCVKSAARVDISGCYSRDNLVGIDVFWPELQGSMAPAAPATLTGNTVLGNQSFGIRVANTGTTLAGNLVCAAPGGGTTGGIILRGGLATVSGNTVSGCRYGIDAAGCQDMLVTGNVISRCGTAVRLDGAQRVNCCSNLLAESEVGVSVAACGDVAGVSVTAGVVVADNAIGLRTPTSLGVLVNDGAAGVAVRDNAFTGEAVVADAQALWVHTDSADISGNRWNGIRQVPVTAGLIGGVPSVIVPDYADDVVLAGGGGPVQQVLTQRQADTIGQVLFVRVLDGGAGYTTASVTIGGGGFGASAVATLVDGRVAWVSVTNPGSGYGGIGTSVPVTITGDGAGALASAVAGLPPLAGREVAISAAVPMTFAATPGACGLRNWTGYAVRVPALGAVRLTGDGTAWQVLPLAQQDYIRPTGDGGVAVQSAGGGDVYLRPSAGGAIHLASGAEPVGCLSCVGRGAPNGVVAAPPGSDYRNLNGGAGATLWLKQAGTDAAGWVAVA